MNHADAHNLLDERMEGMQMPEEVVLKALEMTGDYDPGYTVADAIAEFKYIGKTPIPFK
jgi:hypothetical protein